MSMMISVACKWVSKNIIVLNNHAKATSVSVISVMSMSTVTSAFMAVVHTHARDTGGRTVEVIIDILCVVDAI